MASSIPGARSGLIALLKAQSGSTLSGVAIGRGSENLAGRESITVDDAIEITREHYLGADNTRENFTLPVRVEAIQAGNDFEAVEARMWQLMSVLEKTVLLNQDLSGAVDSATPAGIPDGVQSGPLDDRSVAAGATIRIECFAVVQLAA